MTNLDYEEDYIEEEYEEEESDQELEDEENEDDDENDEIEINFLPCQDFFADLQITDHTITLYNDAQSIAIYAALNGKEYARIEPHQSYIFTTTENDVNVSIIESNTKRNNLPSAILNQAVFDVSLSLQQSAPKEFTINYSSIKALQKLSIIRDCIE